MTITFAGFDFAGHVNVLNALGLGAALHVIDKRGHALFEIG